MKKVLSFMAIVCAIVLVGCNQGKKTAEPAGTNTTEQNKADTHTAQNSLDYTGTYKGVIPCADCEGIETEIILHSDGSFVKKSKYLGKGSEEVFEEKGNYTWDPTGFIITLDGIKDAPNRFRVEENTIRMFDMGGNRIEGELADKYVLRK
jgi:Uncharacterized lipoprotein NlpE involved in copper resistance